MAPLLEEEEEEEEEDEREEGGDKAGEEYGEEEGGEDGGGEVGEEGGEWALKESISEKKKKKKKKSLLIQSRKHNTQDFQNSTSTKPLVVFRFCEKGTNSYKKSPLKRCRKLPDSVSTSGVF